MTAPLVGPKSVSYRLGNIALTQRLWYTQKRPRNEPSPYTTNKWIVQSTFNRDPYYPDMNVEPSPSLLVKVRDAARERFVAKVRGSAAELSVTLAERKQALAMIENRALQLYRFSRDLRQGRIQSAFEQINLTGQIGHWRNDPRLRVKRKAKEFGGAYLEFHFGWSPLVNDIGNAIEVLQGGVPPVHVNAVRGSKEDTWRYPSPGYTQFGSESLLVKVGAEFVVTNPNLWLANQLGFVNPATVAWELVPFSFIVDWFANVSDFLNSFSEFWGLTVVRPYHTVYSRIPQGIIYVPSYPTDPYAGWSVNGTRIYCQRFNTLPAGPSLKIRDPWVLSPRRGLAAISLLLQQLR